MAKFRRWVTFVLIIPTQTSKGINNNGHILYLFTLSSKQSRRFSLRHNTGSISELSACTYRLISAVTSSSCQIALLHPWSEEVERLAHPPYSPDLVRSKFQLIGTLQNLLEETLPTRWGETEERRWVQNWILISFPRQSIGVSLR